MLPVANYTQSQASCREGYKKLYNEFKDKGIDYTKGYIEGRKWNPLNLLSSRMNAAKQALEDMLIDRDE